MERLRGGRERRLTLYRSRRSGDLRIWLITPSRANRSWMFFTPGFLSGLHTLQHRLHRAENTVTHCSSSDFFRYALFSSFNVAEGLMLRCE